MTKLFPNKKTRYEVRLSGAGGQGLITAGQVIAWAMMDYGLWVVQTAAYGPESRGGHSHSDVVISSLEVDFPAGSAPDFLLVMTNDAAEMFCGMVAEGGTILYDSTWVTVRPQSKAAKILEFPLEQWAEELFKNRLVANSIALGIFTKYTGIIPVGQMEKAITMKIPDKIRDINLKAFRKGVEALSK